MQTDDDLDVEKQGQKKVNVESSDWVTSAQKWMFIAILSHLLWGAYPVFAR